MVFPHVEFLVGEKSQDEILFGPHYAFGLRHINGATLVFWLGRHRFAHYQQG